MEPIEEFTRQELMAMEKETMAMEKETTGLYLTGHPMDEYRALARQCKAAPIGAILADFAQEGGPTTYRDEQRVTLAGVVASARTKTTRSNTLMAYVVLEDDTGSMEMLVFARVLGEAGPYLKEGVPVLAEGRLWLYIRIPSLEDPRWEKIRLVLTMFPGTEQMKVRCADTGKLLGTPCLVHDALIRELQELLGAENVVVK